MSKAQAAGKKTPKKRKTPNKIAGKLPKISVLVPVYNVERYLAECLDSLLNQTLNELEIICINDGSTDGSFAILRDYQQRDARIRVIDKVNSGYGASMNLGLRQAQGKYIAILEPDDYIEPEAYAELYLIAEQFAADLVKANYYTERAGQSAKQNLITPDQANRPLNPRQHHELFRLPPAIWSALYQRQFLQQQGITFLETPGASYQDLGFNFKTLASARTVVLVTNAYLHYRLDNENSSVNNPGKVDCVVAEYAEIEHFLMEHQLDQEFGATMVAAKLGNYHWNLQRLSSKLARQFYQTMRAELLAAARAGLIDPTEYSFTRWMALQYILKYPRLAYRVLRLRSGLH